MKKLNRCSYRMARYLYNKWIDGFITQDQLANIFTIDAYGDLIGGWFADFDRSY